MGEVVYVLGDAAVEPAEPVQLGQRAMGRIGRCGADQRIGGPPELPVTTPALETAHEVLVGELARIEPRPDAAGAAKVRDAGFRADARAGEDDRPAGLSKQGCQ